MPAPRSSARLTRARPTLARLARLALVAAPAVARAQQTAPVPTTSQGPDSVTVGAGAAAASQTDPRPGLRAARRTGAIAIDGRLDDAAWAAATPVTNFRQQQPDEGRAPTERTEVRVLYDDVALYVGVRLYDHAPPRGVLVRRDALLNDDNSSGTLTSDRFQVQLDPFRDGNTQVVFELNPDGVRGDMLNGDTSWDPIWQGASHVDSLGWTAEFRIPLSQMRFPRVAGVAGRPTGGPPGRTPVGTTAATVVPPVGSGGPPGGPIGGPSGADVGQTWGLQFRRQISRRNEVDLWAFWRRNEAGGPRYFGALGALGFGPQPRQVELVPYVVTGDKFAAVPAGDPFHRTEQRTARVGADLKVLLTPSLTLDATVNPDFGQVEVDPATVNLSAFETFYEEKRPFFIANSSYFSYGGGNCFFCSNTGISEVFYTRRIGRAPQLAGAVADDAAYMDAPDATTILGAGKVTGRTASGWTIGVLDALTRRATARYVPAAPSVETPAGTGAPSTGAPDVVRRQEVEPLTNYFVARPRKDFRGGDTRVGGLVTLTTRALGDSLERANLRSRSAVVGADVAHYWKQRTYSLRATFSMSDVAGDTAAMRGTEESSAHYFQRPDRRVRSDGLFGAGYDPTRRSLGGYALDARLRKENGDWLWETQQRWRSPGYELNDVGYLNRADVRYMNANLARQWTTPGRWYRQIFAIVGGQTAFNYDGDRTDGQGQAYLSVQFPNYWSAQAFAIHHPSNFDDRLTRGGPVVRRFGYDYTNAQVSSDGRRPVVYSLGLGHAKGLANEGFTNELNAGITVKPSSRVLVSLSPSFSRDITAQQYVSTVSDTSAPAGFYGHRYLFGTVDQRTLALETRVNTTFTPSLTLELYAQPFLASGSYRDLKEFAAPRTSAARVYGRDFGSLCRDASGNYTLDPAAAPGAACPAAGAPAAATAFGVGNPDFNYRSLRGTAVLRWEYRPGSTVFAVWTQQRSGSAGFGDFDFARDRVALFRDRPINVFQLKATYWLGR